MNSRDGQAAPPEYDEFGLLADNAAEAGLPWTGPPALRRESVDVDPGTPGQPPGQQVSVLVWGKADPELVLLHGGAQNAHTWDTVALALRRPLIAVDLPGHGRSSWRADRDYWPARNAEAVAAAVSALAPRARAVVGMSLGGLTAIRLAAARPDLVRRLVVVDVTPGVTAAKSAPIAEFVQGPESFGSFDEMLERTSRYNPSRSVSSLRRGLLHNARPLPDGRWAWRYDRLRPPGSQLDFAGLWADLAAVTVPVMLICGAKSGVVSDEDRAEFRRRQPTARLETVDGAGHSIQGDRPVELAALIEDFIASSAALATGGPTPRHPPKAIPGPAEPSVVVGGLAQERLADPGVRQDQEPFGVHGLDHGARDVFRHEHLTQRAAVRRSGGLVVRRPAEHAGIDRVRAQARHPDPAVPVVQREPLGEPQRAVLGHRVPRT